MGNLVQSVVVFMKDLFGVMRVWLVLSGPSYHVSLQNRLDNLYPARNPHQSFTRTWSRCLPILELPPPELIAYVPQGPV